MEKEKPFSPHPRYGHMALPTSPSVPTNTLSRAAPPPTATGKAQARQQAPGGLFDVIGTSGLAPGASSDSTDGIETAGLAT
jgi:hypothetical protein